MNIELEIKKIALNYFKVSFDDIKIIKRFMGGMSNYTYLVKVKDTNYVIRKIGDKGLPIINPKTEKDHLETIEPLNISSHFIYLNPENGDKITSYIKGEALSNDFINEDFKKVADILKKLHQSNLPGHDYELEKRLNHYESLLTNKPTNKYYSLKDYWFKLYSLKYKESPKVLCHGDAQRSNFVKDPNGKIHLLDWEFTGLNDLYFDIASFGNIDFNDSIILLEKYLNKKPTKDEINKVRFYRMYQVLQWHIVAKYKEEEGLSEKLHLDFAKISNNYLIFAEVLYNNIKGD
ncbi:MAG: choline/ethanolamine kinase family protein [Acholeplasmataceae bacterium]